MERIPEADLFNTQVFVVAVESTAQLDNKAREEGHCEERREAMLSSERVPGTIYFCFTVIWDKYMKRKI